MNPTLITALAKLDEARERAQRRAKAQPLKPADEAHLGKLLDRSIQRDRYLVTMPVLVIFSPPQTLAEVQARYPGCKVEQTP